MNNVASAMHDVILSWALFAGLVLLVAIPIWLVAVKPWKPQKHWSQTTVRVPLSCDDHPSFIAAVIVCPPKLIGSCFHAAKNEHEQQSEVQYPERAA